jgi:Zn-dependent peptidase ImmA (M78 family)
MAKPAKNPQREASRLLTHLRIDKAPIPVEKIARHLGALIRFSVLDDEISGMVFVKEGTAIIGVNALHHPNRQRFTIAHEIAHLLLHREFVSTKVHVDKGFPVLMRNKVASLGTDLFEIEANRFAAELLMPTSLVSALLHDRIVDVDDEKLIRDLANQFKVSKQAMGHRISALLEPWG